MRYEDEFYDEEARRRPSGSGAIRRRPSSAASGRRTVRSSSQGEGRTASSRSASAESRGTVRSGASSEGRRTEGVRRPAAARRTAEEERSASPQRAVRRNAGEEASRRTVRGSESGRSVRRSQEDAPLRRSPSRSAAPGTRSSSAAVSGEHHSSAAHSRTGHIKREAAAKKSKKRTGRLIAMIAIEALILVAAIVVLVVVSRVNKITTPNWGKITIQHNEDIDEEVLQAMAEGYTDIMIFGVDARMISDYNTLDKGAGADVNILAHIDNKTGEVKLVSFFRDMWVKGDDGRYRKLADEYRRGGAAAALNTINRNFDLNVNTFVTSNWYAAATGINMLGGVDVNLPSDALGQFNGLLTETVDETGIGTEGQIFEGGMHHLDGPQTVAYCRIRKIDFEGYDYGDFGRAQRQREVLGLLLAKAKQLSVPELAAIVDSLLTDVYTNVDIGDALALASQATRFNVTNYIGFPYEKDGIEVNINGSNADFVVAYDLEANVLRLHQELYGTDDGYKPSETVQDISYYIYSNYGY